MAPNDPLNQRLQDAGSAIPVDDEFDMLNNVHRRVTTRRRRMRIAAALGVGAVLIAGGVVATDVLGDGEPDSLSIAGVDDPTPTTVPDPDDSANASEGTDIDEAPTATTVPASAPPTTATPAPAPPAGPAAVETIDAVATLVAVPADLRDAQLNWVVPWQDGFLASRTLSVPQALPSELPEEIRDLFPQEVIDFFAGDLPPTIAEATEMLSAAGLLDEVTAVLNEHPEASEVIYSQPTVAPSLTVMFSPDGVDWEPVDFVMPAGAAYMQSVRSTGDRLVAVVDLTDPNGVDESAGAPVEFSSVVVVTTDLQNWEQIALPAPQQDDAVPDFVNSWWYPQSLTVNENGWLSVVSRQYDVDVAAVLSLLAPDVLERLGDDTDQLSTGFEPDGLTLYRFDEVNPDQEPQTVTVPWSDLGIAQASVDAAFQGSQVTVAAQWGEAPVVVDRVEAFNIVGSSDGFYASSEIVEFSADGVEWTQLTVPDEVLFVESLLPLDEGVVAFGYAEEGRRTVHLIDGASNTWTELALPDLPSQMFGGYFGQAGTRGAMILNTADTNFGGGQAITVEVDGYVATLTLGYPLSSVRLVDADGNVLVDEQTVDAGGQGETDSYIRTEDGGFTFIDVETGDEIVTIPSAAIAEQYDNVEPTEFEEPDIDLWVLATLDGQRWLFEDLGPDDSDMYFGESPVALNGSTLLVAVGPEWSVFDLS